LKPWEWMIRATKGVVETLRKPSTGLKP